MCERHGYKTSLLFYVITAFIRADFLLTVDIPICFSKDAHFIGFGPLLKRNLLAFISLFLAILGWLVASFEKQKWAGVTNPPYKIKGIKNENYEYLTFLTTYIIPLICIDLTKIRYVFVLAVLLVLIGFIFIRMDLYCGNPTLALMGYRLYSKDGTQIRLDTKKSKIAFLKLMNDAFLHSELTQQWYDASAKGNITQGAG